MTVRNIAAIDLGASSGRVMLASYHTGTRRIAAWVIGTHNMKKALLRALLEPTDQLRQLELAGDYTARFALLEEQKSLPWQAPTANAVMCRLARIG